VTSESGDSSDQPAGDANAQSASGPEASSGDEVILMQATPPEAILGSGMPSETPIDLSQSEEK
jgi:hypothetical protein